MRCQLLMQGALMHNPAVWSDSAFHFLRMEISSWQGPSIGSAYYKEHTTAKCNKHYNSNKTDYFNKTEWYVHHCESNLTKSYSFWTIM